MATLVENIEIWSMNKSDSRLFEIVKKQLKDKKTDVNKLSKNLKGDADISPLHAAVASNSTELFNLVLGTEGVNPDSEYFLEGESMGGILDLAVLSLNIDMVQLVLQKVKYSNLKCFYYEGQAVANCLVAAVNFDRLDLVQLLVSHEVKYPELSPLHSLVFAIMLNKNNIFAKVLPQAMSKIDEPFGDCKETLVHKAVKYMRVNMLRQLVELGCNVNMKDVHGCTPLMVVVSFYGSGICGDGCGEQIVSELLSCKSIDLDIIHVMEGIDDRRAIDHLNEKTCPHIRKLIEQAYRRYALRKKLEKSKEPKEEVVSKKQGFRGSKSVKTVPSSKDENKICWSCSADPDKVTLFRCKGCKVAWYCKDKCQEVDWPVHGPWCERKSNKREQKRKAKAEEELTQTRLPEVFCDLDLD